MKNHDIEFFTQEDVDLLILWANKAYNKNNEKHRNAKQKLLDSVWAKTVYWNDEVINRLKGFQSNSHRMWSKRGWDNSSGKKIPVSKFKPYTWTRIYKNNDLDKDIFFTVGVDAERKVLVYKIDYFYEKKSRLTVDQQELCRQLIPEEASWIQVQYKDIPKYNWERLINETVLFIRNNEPVYDSIMKSVWTNKISVFKLKNRLIKRTIPETGYDSIPSKKFTFNGHDIDWDGKYEMNNETGKLGEQLVIEFEKSILQNGEREDLVKYVKKVEDGNGYDVESRNIDGTKKFIEVKSTPGNANTIFPITINEISFSELNPDSYYLYRVFNLDKKNRVAEFHEFKGNLNENFLLDGIQFNAYRKSK